MKLKTPNSAHKLKKLFFAKLDSTFNQRTKIQHFTILRISMVLFHISAARLLVFRLNANLEHCMVRWTNNGKLQRISGEPLAIFG